MRLFFAVSPPAGQRGEIVRCVEEFWGPMSGRILPEENLHLTLAFLGETDPTRLGELESATLRLSERPSFEVEWGGLEAFPRFRNARVLVLGVRRGARELDLLVRELNQVLPEDLRPEPGRPFRPHLTLARFKAPPPVRELERLREDLSPYSWRSRMGGMELFRSHLDPAGARYESLFRVEFASS